MIVQSEEMTWNHQMKTVIKIWSEIMVILRLLTISSNKRNKTCIKEIILKLLPSHLTRVVNGRAFTIAERRIKFWRKKLVFYSY